MSETGKKAIMLMIEILSSPDPVAEGLRRRWEETLRSAPLDRRILYVALMQHFAEVLAA
jgi:hypothetical protein